jgi:hypothetical protein
MVELPAQNLACHNTFEQHNIACIHALHGATRCGAVPGRPRRVCVQPGWSVFLVRLGDPEGDDIASSRRRRQLRLARCEEVEKSKEGEEEKQTRQAVPPPRTGCRGRDGEGGLGEGAAAALHLDEDAAAEATAVPGPPRGGPSRATGDLRLVDQHGQVGDESVPLRSYRRRCATFRAAHVVFVGGWC